MEAVVLLAITRRFVLAVAVAGLVLFLSGSSRQMSMLPRARSLWERVALQVPLLPPQTVELVALAALASFD